ncbi:hypothetical protein BDQ12DRAFT_607081 [Crucibulum laeve]|uniref:F-box domain-containing protein n=1 Tax=Crucibulum laeve TaxID=68775 RepID=A0A5C3LYB8_9AGAR|nr:hypothetical protein BDQ12DRAFT_607081 [Crucibulum laeve]
MQRLVEGQISREALVKSTRRRSLKTFFHNSLSTRSSVYQPLSTKRALGWIPEDIILEIVDLLSPLDVQNLSVTSSHLRTLLLPTIYETVVLKSSRKCKMALNTLELRPEICRCIKKLAVRPNYYLSWPKADEYLDEAWLARKISGISQNLSSLHTFDWDGLELPQDYLWGTLQTHCPKLKNIFTNVGTQPFHSNSQLFAFKDLTSFSLVVRHGLNGNDFFFQEMEDLPDEFWTMIIKHCPDLEELAICSFSSAARLFNFKHITEGHWPKLHTLTIGSFGYQSDFSLGPPQIDIGLGRFLNEHQSLDYIRFLWNFKRWMSPELIPMHLPPSSLPVLTTFIGVYQQLIDLPHPESVTTLDLTCEPVYELRIPMLCAMLKTLVNLTSLDLWTHVLNPRRNHSALFYDILTSCPKLTDFHFMCTTAFTLTPMKNLIKQLHLLPELRNFSLTKGHDYIDEEMMDSALRILKYNPRLQQINIRWARERCPNHLKQEGTYDVLSTDEEGNAKVLMVTEKGIPLVGPAFERKLEYDLAPKNIFAKMSRMHDSLERRHRKLILRALRV